MTSYIHIPILIACFFMLLSVQRWWLCISRMGFVRELGRRAPALVRGDVLAVAFAASPFVIAVLDWLGFAMLGQTVIASPVAVFLSLASLGASVFVLGNSGERFAGHWAGTRESALRTVAMLRIIDAAELAHALDVLQQHEAQEGGK